MTYSFIGAGNMARALITGALAVADPKNIIVTDYFAEKAMETAQALGCTDCEGNGDAAVRGDIIFLCVKPQILPEVLKALSPVLNAGLLEGKKKCLVSIAAGVTIASIRQSLTGECAEMPIIRVMPNIASGVGKGMLAIAGDGAADSETMEAVCSLLNGCGRVDRLPESLFDQFTVISGCLPAYVFMLIEALADGAVLTGLPRDKAMEYAAQTIAGSAAMYLERSDHPGALKDMVCSPGGSTIAGLAALERSGFRGAVIDAVLAAFGRNAELGK